MLLLSLSLSGWKWDIVRLFKEDVEQIIQTCFYFVIFLGMLDWVPIEYLEIFQGLCLTLMDLVQALCLCVPLEHYPQAVQAPAP